MERYRIDRLIGEGSYGNAYLCALKDNATKMYVMKKIRLGKLSETEREAAWQEVRILKQLKYPFVLSHVDSFTDQQDLCIVTDYCDGGDLFSRLKVTREFFPEEWILDKFVQICLALEYLHNKKILHRDIKSQNVFCQKDGTIKLGDFGIAKVLLSPMDMAKTLIGTPYFMSPEVMSNKPYDFKSDVWGLGCILYEMASLKHAFDASCMNGLALKILRGKIEPLPPQYSDNLRGLSMMLLSKAPENRPTCSEVGLPEETIPTAYKILIDALGSPIVQILELPFLEPIVIIHKNLAAKKSREWDSEFLVGPYEKPSGQTQASTEIENDSITYQLDDKKPAGSKKMLEVAQKNLADLELFPSKDRVLLEKERRRKDAEEQKISELRKARIEYANKRKAASTKQAEIYRQSDTLQGVWTGRPDEGENRFSSEEGTSTISVPRNEEDTSIKLQNRERHDATMGSNNDLSSDNALERASAIRLLCTHELGEGLFRSLYKYMSSKSSGPYSEEDKKEEADFFTELKDRLGETKMQYVHLIDHLIYLEENF